MGNWISRKAKTNPAKQRMKRTRLPGWLPDCLPAWEICNKIMLKENLRHRTGKFRTRHSKGAGCPYSQLPLPLVSSHVRAVKMKIESNKNSARAQHGVYVMSGKKLWAFQPAIRGSWQWQTVLHTYWVLGKAPPHLHATFRANHSRLCHNRMQLTQAVKLFCRENVENMKSDRLTKRWLAAWLAAWLAERLKK